MLTMAAAPRSCGRVNSGNEELVQFLLMSGADVSWSNSIGGTALNFAIEKKNTNLIRILQTEPKKAEPNAPPNASPPHR